MLCSGWPHGGMERRTVSGHNWYSSCAKCGTIHRKREMRPLYVADSNSLPPRLLCYLCQACYCILLDELEICE